VAGIRPLHLPLATLAALVVTTSTAFAAVPTHEGSFPRYDHIFVIVEENHGFRDVIGNPAAPNLNALAGRFGLATQYFGVAHPSEPNYVGLLGGNFFGIADDNPYWMNGVNEPSLISQLDTAGISWRAYLQGSPHKGYEGICYPARCNGTPDNDPLYVSKHDGIQNFATSLNPSDWGRQVPVSDLGHDLAAGTVPRFDYVIPDECHDMHGDPPYCIDGGNPGDPQDQRLVAMGDAYLGHLVSQITNAPFWATGNNAIAIVYDEGDFNGGCCDASPGGGRVASIVVTSHGPRGVMDATPYNHYSLLSSIQHSFGLGCLQFTCDTANVHPMRPLFKVTGSPAVATQLIAVPNLPTPTPTPAEPTTRTRLAPTSGGWRVQKSALFGGSDNSLGAVAGGASGTWAVGNFLPDTPSSNQDATLSLANRFNGKRWSVVPTPNAGPNFNTLFGVAAAGREAWAVGVHLNNAFLDRALVEKWSQGRWRITRVPQPGTQRDLLFAVSATSPTDVWAVGDQEGRDGRFETLVEHFDGTKWSVVPSPDPGSTGNHLYGVKAVSPNDVWAVGQQLGASAPDQGLIEHWNGAAWAVVPTPPQTGNIMLDAVAAGDGQVWAVGESDDPVRGARPFIETTNGNGWQVADLSRAGTDFTSLWGAASSGKNAWAVGTYVDPATGNNETLVLRGRGVKWKVVNAPDPGSGSNILGGVAPTPAGLLAVGTYDTGGPQLTLVERRLGHHG